MSTIEREMKFLAGRAVQPAPERLIITRFCAFGEHCIFYDGGQGPYGASVMLEGPRLCTGCKRLDITQLKQRRGQYLEKEMTYKTPLERTTKSEAFDRLFDKVAEKRRTHTECLRSRGYYPCFKLDPANEGKKFWLKTDYRPGIADCYDFACDAQNKPCYSCRLVFAEMDKVATLKPYLDSYWNRYTVSEKEGYDWNWNGTTLE